MIQKLKEYNKAFWTEEDGMELLQLALIVVVTVGLFVVVINLKDTIATYIQSANDEVQNRFDEALNSNN